MTSKITSLPDLLIWLNYRNRAQKDICDSDGKCLIMTSILLVKKAKSIFPQTGDKKMYYYIHQIHFKAKTCRKVEEIYRCSTDLVG